MTHVPPHLTVCFHCLVPYDVLVETGHMACYCHPLPLDSLTEHYPCCGASILVNDTAHAEFIPPRGCHRVDHAASFEERRQVIELPYLILPVEKTKKLEGLNPHFALSNQHYLVNDKNDLSANYVFSGPNGEFYNVDLFHEHDRLLKKSLQKKTRGVNSTADYYVYPSIPRKDQPELASLTSAADFIPFYVIRCCMNKKDLVKMRGIDPRAPCEFREMNK
jgi:hypothetical protein